MKKRKAVKRHKKKLPFYKEQWFLMLMGLSIFALFVVVRFSTKTPDVLGIASDTTLWSLVIDTLSN